MLLSILGGHASFTFGKLMRLTPKKKKWLCSRWREQVCPMKGKSSQPKEIRRLTVSRSVSSFLGRLGGGGAPGVPGGLIPLPRGVLGGDEYILANSFQFIL